MTTIGLLLTSKSIRTYPPVVVDGRLVDIDDRERSDDSDDLSAPQTSCSTARRLRTSAPRPSGFRSGFGQNLRCLPGST